MHECIRVVGARQNNLQNVTLELPLGRMSVVTGVSGSGKSSLAFDTIYAEGQRRYVETFSAYARQFLDRMDKPAVERIEGIPPAVAIQQVNPVRTSRSTVGTMTEINDHLKLLYARAARLYCPGCDAPVRRDTPESIWEALRTGPAQAGARAVVTFPVPIPENFDEEEVLALLGKQGYTRIHRREAGRLEVVQDRLSVEGRRKQRWLEAFETALRHGQGHVAVWVEGEEPARYSSALHCAGCDVAFRDPVPNLFSFNSAIGACETCRGFGRVIGVDPGLVVPDHGKTLAEGAVRPWQTESYRECQQDMVRFAKRAGVPLDVPWRALTEEQRAWVMEGEGSWEDGLWYGVARFFTWLESKAYKMHIRVLLSKYREYRECPACHGARLRPEALNWRLVVGRRRLPLHALVQLPIEESARLLRELRDAGEHDEATAMVLDEILGRLGFLLEVGLGYLTLDRQSRTLSGGEVQRINLTTALGSSLVNALFVLDEPSIGLHPRDIDRLVGVLHRLRDAGNTLLVVEHDPAVIAAADHVVELGPGPGERGGQIVFEGTVAQLKRSRASATGAFLAGRLRVATGARRALPPEPAAWLRLSGASQHNLKAIDVAFPLDRLVVVAGVSGSGKSTLVQDVLHRQLCRCFGVATETPGRCTAMLGWEAVEEVVLVDQAPIGKTARSNPASYVGAFDALRSLFASAPLAIQRGYTAGTFSFNAGTGRCPVCQGTGFEHVEMQFLSDVYIECPDCHGSRYRNETLEVKLVPASGAAVSIADVLAMTVEAACTAFADQPEVLRRLAPLRDVGLGYLRLGQPVPTLSGGEAQRLKLAGHLAGGKTRAARSGRTLFLLDEPTTGLHFEDVAVLLKVLYRLVAAGHGVIVVEHNLDVLAAAEWLIELGPEGGDQGGEVVFAGTPEELAAGGGTVTADALGAYLGRAPLARVAERAPAWPVQQRSRRRAPAQVSVHHAREHNLRNVSVSIPRDSFTVVTGVSGSGKSTLAFDILFAEGQRRYLECLNAYARQFVQPASRPDVDAITGIPPAVAIEQRLSRGGYKSTVATVTEVYHFLRLLFVRLGVQHCPACAVPIESQTPAQILGRVMTQFRGTRVRLLAPLVTARKGIYADLAKWCAGRGFESLRLDGAWVPTQPWTLPDRYVEHTIELPVAELVVTPAREGELAGAIEAALGYGSDTLLLLSGRTGSEPVVFSATRSCPSCGRGFEELDPRLFSYNSRHGWCETCQGAGVMLEEGTRGRKREEEPKVCRACNGKRLNETALSVHFAGRTIDDFSALSVSETATLFGKLKLTGRDAEVARDVVSEIDGRLRFLSEVGLSYLSLGRAAPTLSGGEAQRIRLAAQLGSNLRGVCYILDEPTIGLHARDNQMLLNTLEGLQQRGNTVLVVEHDEETICRAQHVVDLGPGAGVLGGEIVAQGTPAAIRRSRRSLTGKFLREPLRHPLRGARRDCRVRACKVMPHPVLTVKGARLHNLQGLDVPLPLERLVVVTGVSGSGKSTLVRDILYTGVHAGLAGRKRRPGCTAIEGLKALRRVIEVDQSPIGRTPRSCPATYVGFWGEIRALFAATPDARIRGYDAGRFSFNTEGGRCPLCSGQGVTKVEMSFLPNVEMVCDGCGGTRFTAETRELTYAARSISEVLALNVDQAVALFAAHPAIHAPLQLMQDVGLGYLTLGQRSSTLSGGEAQRIKLVSELARCRSPQAQGGTLYLLDEPTVGLHMSDVERLIQVLHRLVDAGNSVVVIEHNLDLIAEADWVVDLGPEGGDAGGRVVAAGSPERVARVARSYTGQFLKRFLAERGGPQAQRRGGR